MKEAAQPLDEVPPSENHPHASLHLPRNKGSRTWLGGYLHVAFLGFFLAALPAAPASPTAAAAAPGGHEGWRMPHLANTARRGPTQSGADTATHPHNPPRPPKSLQGHSERPPRGSGSRRGAAKAMRWGCRAPRGGCRAAGCEHRNAVCGAGGKGKGCPSYLFSLSVVPRREEPAAPTSVGCRPARRMPPPPRGSAAAAAAHGRPAALQAPSPSLSRIPAFALRVAKEGVRLDLAGFSGIPLMFAPFSPPASPPIARRSASPTAPRL